VVPSLAALAVLALAGGADAQTPPAPTAGAVSEARVVPGSAPLSIVPYQDWNGLIVIQAILGDGLPERAVLDTGLPISCVTPAYAARRALTSSGQSKDVPILNRTVRLPLAQPQNLRLTQMGLSGVSLGIFGVFENFSARTQEDGPGLWLGTSTLLPLCITIDPAARHLQLRPANSPPPPKATRLPFALRDGRIWIDVQVNGKVKFEALVDTGAVSTLIPMKAARELALMPLYTADVTDSVGKQGKAAIVRLDELSLGGLKVKNVHAVHMEESAPEPGSHDLAVIGNDVLLRYRVTIDYGRRDISFEELAQPKPMETPAGNPAPTDKNQEKGKPKKDAGKRDAAKEEKAKQPEPPKPVDTPPPPAPIPDMPPGLTPP
jgi:hypothetical protein